MIKIAIMGLGTVGTGVAKVVAENGKQIERKLGEPVEVKAILVRHFKDGPYRQLMTDDFQKIEEDPEIRVVVETIGGVDAAYEYTRRALEAGKSVVTANKQLVAEKGCELLELAKRKNVSYLFEASVGGGIPILHPLTECLAANRIEEIYGILNGTTNYILTKMVRSGAFFVDALREAQTKGYAESDPTADVEGIDAGRKICILADLAFGHQVPPELVPMEGISKLSLRDVKIAERAGYRIKLLGRTVRLPGGGRTAYVAPHLIPETNPLSNVEDVFNAVVVRGNATGEVMFYGKGAGELPTASACVSDVMEAVTRSTRGGERGWSADTEGFVDPQELHTRFYFRIEGSLTDAAAAFGQVEVLSEDGETAFLTDRISGSEAAEQAGALNVLACMRVLA
jgi:Homoserine dehydrogenase